MLAFFEQQPFVLVGLLFPVGFGLLQIQGRVDDTLSKARTLCDSTTERAITRKIRALRGVLIAFLVLLLVFAVSLVVSTVEVAAQTLSGPGQFAPLRVLVVLACGAAIAELSFLWVQDRRLANW